MKNTKKTMSSQLTDQDVLDSVAENNKENSPSCKIKKRDHRQGTYMMLLFIFQ